MDERSKHPDAMQIDQARRNVEYGDGGYIIRLERPMVTGADYEVTGGDSSKVG